MFDFCWKFTLSWEGGLCDDAGDPGGVTKFGVDIRMLKDMEQRAMARARLQELGVKLPISRASVVALTERQAANIYRFQVWDALGLTLFPPIIQAVLFDAGVNNGNAQAVKFIQKAHNTLKPGFPLVVDGKLGPKSRQAILLSDPAKLAAKAIDRREYFFNSLVKAAPARKKFLKGWINRINDLRRYLGV